jgi:hypothetical protein
LTAEWFFVPKIASPLSQKTALAFNAYRPEVMQLFFGETDFQWRVSRLHMTTHPALRAVIKEHRHLSAPHVPFNRLNHQKIHAPSAAVLQVV